MITHKIRSISLLAALATVSLGGSFGIFSYKANADLPGKHPYYLHALTDLRTARWLLEHRPADATVSGQEDVAIQQVDATINEIKKAAIDDGKNLKDHPKVDVPNDHARRLHKAEELLKKVRSDVGREEDDPTAQGLKKRALYHIAQAIKADERAIYDVTHHK